MPACVFPRPAKPAAKNLPAILILAAMLGLIPAKAMAQDAAAASTPSREALLKLAREFIQKVNKGFTEADNDANLIDKDTLRREKELASLADGEMLLMQPRLGRMELNQTVMAVKQGDDIMLSLTDFATAAGFAITVRGGEGIADGWFTRESQAFKLDIAANTVTIKDKAYPLSPGDAEVDGDDILVKSQTLSKWFDFKLDPYLSMQRMDIATNQKWPVEERIARRARMKAQMSNTQKEPELPLLEEEYNLASIPNIDVNIRQRYKNDPEEEAAQKRTDYSVVASGDLLNHTARTVVNGSNERKLQNVYFTLSKESEEPDLLGLLKAKQYSVGDITPVGVPNTGTAPSERGVRISSRNAYVTSGTSTMIEGNATPGWDVELYRNDQLIGTMAAGDDGRYLFNDVFLYAGDNNFRIVQYGPQGEVREDKRSIAVDPALTEAGQGLYDVSASMQNTNTWSAIKETDKDKNSPHLAGTYALQLTPRTSAYGGARMRQENEIDKIYLSSGIATSFDNKTLLNADIGYDIDNAYIASVSARRRFGQQNTAITGRYQSEDFAINGGIIPSPSQFSILTSSSGPIPYLEDYRISYELSSSYSEASNDRVTKTNELSVFGKLNKLWLGNRLSRSQMEFNDIKTDETTGSFTVRGSAYKTYWRGGVGYSVSPETSINSYLLGLSRNLAPKWSGSLEMQHKPEDGYSAADLSLSWNGEQARISPEISYDSNGVINALLNVRFGITRDPSDGEFIFSGKGLSNSAGIAARAYLDKDGDLEYSDGDELLEGVAIRAVQFNREVLTDEKGEGFLTNINATRATDITVDPDGMPDPTWISARPGVSIRPRPGHVTQLDFPIHMTGEIDGTVYAPTPFGKPRAVRNMRISLYTLDGKHAVTATTATDGFYLLEKIPPGKYYLTPHAGDLADARLSAPKPEIITIGYDGPTMFGHNIMLAEQTNAQSVTFEMVSARDIETNYPDMPPSAEQVLALNLGTFNSPMAMNLLWYKLKTRHTGLVAGFTPLFRASQSPQNVKTGLHTMWLKTAGQDVSAAMDACKALSAQGISCRVEMIPALTGKSASAAPSPEGKKS